MAAEQQLVTQDVLARRESHQHLLDEAMKALYVGLHRGAYDDQARMWDRLGARSPESFPAPRHAAEVTS